MLEKVEMEKIECPKCGHVGNEKDGNFKVEYEYGYDETCEYKFPEEVKCTKCNYEGWAYEFNPKRK